MKILVVGSIALDTVRTPYVQGDHILGGSAVHFANAASIMAEGIDMVGVVGEDFTDGHIAFLKRKKVDVTGLIREKGLTFHWEGYYEKDMNQAITVKTELNVFQTFNPVLPASYKDDPIVFLANIDPVLQLRVLDNMKKPSLVVCDTMNYWIDTKKQDLLNVIKRANIALFNDAEIRSLTGIQNIRLASAELLKLGLDCIIVKRGEYGFLVISKQDTFAGAAVLLDDVKDPTGAGDSFAGGFVSYLSKKGDFSFSNIRKAVVYANLVASFNVQQLGLEGLDKVTFPDIKKRLVTYRELTAFGGI
jgi:sugar/nucleoside kinase (ribokinase family)